MPYLMKLKMLSFEIHSDDDILGKLYRIPSFVVRCISLFFAIVLIAANAGKLFS